MTPSKSARCPTCRGVAHRDSNKVFPFCSERCQLADLGRWLAEEYRIPDEPDVSGGGIESSNPQRTDEN
jgi:uncharacterized protein